MKNPFIKNGYFLGRWLVSKVEDFRTLSDEEKLKHLNQLIIINDRSKLERGYIDDKNTKYHSMMKILEKASKDGRYAIKHGNEIINAIQDYMESDRKYEEFCLDDK